MHQIVPSFTVMIKVTENFKEDYVSNRKLEINYDDYSIWIDLYF